MGIFYETKRKLRTERAQEIWKELESEFVTTVTWGRGVRNTCLFENGGRTGPKQRSPKFEEFDGMELRQTARTTEQGTVCFNTSL